MSRSRIRSITAAICLTSALAIIVIAGSGRLEDERPVLVSDPYLMAPAEPQPTNWYHFNRNHDPWARDGYVKRGSFTVERKVEHGIRDRFWLTITGKVGHHIRCHVRGYSEVEGHSTYDGWSRVYKGNTAVVTELLPTIHKGQFDVVMCHDTVTGETRNFEILPWKSPDPPRDKAPWETDQAVKWMKANGLKDFTSKDAPLHDTRYESKLDWDYDGEYSPGEKYLYLHGLPPLSSPYEEFQGGNLSPEEAKMNIPYKDDYKYLKDQDMKTLKRSRVWSSYWKAWQAGLAKDKADGVPVAEWSQHWN